MKKFIPYFLIFIFLISLSFAFTENLLDNDETIFRVLDNYIITADGNNVNYYNQDGTLINSINVSPYSPLSFLKSGIPSYDDSSSLNVNCKSSIVLQEYIICSINKDSDILIEYNISSTFSDFGLFGIFEVLGVTEDYFLVSYAYSNNLYSFAIDKNNFTNYIIESYVSAHTTHYVDTEVDLILPSTFLTSVGGSTFSVFGSFIPYYENGIYYNYISDSFFSKSYPIYYDNNNINNRILLEGSSLGVSSGSINTIHSAMISKDGEYYYVGNKFFSQSYLSGTNYRSMKIGIKDNSYTTNEYYTFTNKDGDEENIEEGIYLENGIYRITHDNNGTLRFTINDIEPENFNFNLYCDSGFCDFAHFNLLENGNIVYYNISDFNTYIIDGSPSVDSNPTIRLFGNIFPPSYNNEYNDILPQWLILQNTSTNLVFPYDYTSYVYDILNPSIIDMEYKIFKLIQVSEETANSETEFIIQASDLTNDNINLAYDCNYNENKLVGDSDNYDVDYITLFDNYGNTTCGMVILETPDIIASNYIDNTNSIIFDENCNQEISFAVDTYSNDYISYINSILIGEGKGLTTTFYNKYNDEILELTIQHQKLSTPTTETALAETVFEGWETGDFNSNNTRWNSDNWTVVSNHEISTESYSGTYTLESHGNVNDTSWVTRSINLEGATEVILSFWVKSEGYDNSGEYGYLIVGDENISVYSSVVLDDNTWRYHEYELSSYGVNFTNDTNITFYSHVSSETGDESYIDDITIDIYENSNTFDIYNYVYISLNDEVIYNTTSVNNIVNTNLDVILSFYPTRTIYNIGGLVSGEINNVITLPVKSITWDFLNKTNTTATPDNVVIGSWVLLNDDFFPEQNEGVSYINYINGYRYYSFTCDYSLYDNDEKVLRIYYDDNTINYNRFEDYTIEYQSVLLNYTLPITNNGVTIEEEAIEQRKSKSKEFYCTAINICDDDSRMFLAVVVLLITSLFSAALMYKKYENTTASQLLPALVFSIVFIYFASIGFLQPWFIVLTIITLVGYMSIALNPVRRVSQ